MRMQLNPLSIPFVSLNVTLMLCLQYRRCWRHPSRRIRIVCLLALNIFKASFVVAVKVIFLKDKLKKLVTFGILHLYRVDFNSSGRHEILFNVLQPMSYRK